MFLLAINHKKNYRKNIPLRRFNSNKKLVSSIYSLISFSFSAFFSASSPLTVTI